MRYRIGNIVKWIRVNINRINLSKEKFSPFASRNDIIDPPRDSRSIGGYLHGWKGTIVAFLWVDIEKEDPAERNMRESTDREGERDREREKEKDEAHRWERDFYI